MNYGTLNANGNGYGTGSTSHSGNKSISGLITKSQHRRQASLDANRFSGIFKSLSRKPSHANGFGGGSEHSGELAPMLDVVSRPDDNDLVDEEIRKEEEESSNGVRLWYS